MKKTVVLSAMLLLGIAATAQKFQLMDQNNQGVTIGHELKELPYQYVTINGQQYIDFGKTQHVLSMENGAPALPKFNTSIQLPATGNSIIVVEYDAITELQNVNIAPSKGNLKRNVDPSTVPYTFGNAYQQDAFYPANAVTLNNPFVWRSMRGQTITISPYQYNPVTKVLRIHENMRVRVVYQPTVAGLNETTVSKTDKVMGSMQQRFILNPTAEKYTPVEEEGEMLIITAPAYTDEMAPFVTWKNQKGIKTTMVTTDVAGTVDTDIKAYVQNFYSANPDLVYVLLVGDHSGVPAHTYGMDSDNEDLWSDSYYGQLAGGATDFFPEAFVGRFSGNDAQIALMVSRTLEYEISPAPGDWMQKAIGIGSGEGAGIGDDGEADWQHIRNIRTRLMSYGYTDVYEFYDGSRGGADADGNPSSTIIMPALNSGVGLFNYTGHGDVNLCYTGNFTSTNVNAATNNGMYPMVISVACSNGTFTSGTCLSEVWLRADNNGTPAGAIGAAGSSILMAWAQPMQTQDEMTEIIAEAYPTNKKTTTGGLFYNSQISMLEQYGDLDGTQVMQTWIYFGDPSTQFRNKITQELTVVHPSQVPIGTSSMTVVCNVEGAVIAISQGDVFLGKGIVTGGMVTIYFPVVTTDQPLAVVGTKQNYTSYRGPVQVGAGAAGINELSASVSLFPNPATQALHITGDNNTVESAEIITLTGQTVGSFTATNGQLTADLSGIATGSYLVRIVTTKGTTIKHLEVVR